MMSNTAWIIGASSGIGEALAYKLASEGYALTLSARREESLNALAKQLKDPEAHSVIPCDVSDLSSLRSAYEALEDLSLVIFAAGIYEPMGMHEYNHDTALKTLSVNLTGAFNLYEVVQKQAIDPSKFLHIAWIASVAGYRGLPNSCAYGVSKAGMINLAEIQRTELEQFNTKVQVINPGFVKTRLTDKNDFQMPMIIPSEKAAEYIYKGLHTDRFEIAFPPVFALIMKLIRIFPDFIFFKLMQYLIKQNQS